MNQKIDKPWRAIVESCETDLAKHGDSFLGVGWTKKQEYAERRYKIMLDLVREVTPVTMLDVGCGAAHLYEHILSQDVKHIEYSGLDLSSAFLELSKRKFPDIEFYGQDILDPECRVPSHDYLVMNGLFNWKGDKSFDEMWCYCRDMIARAFELSRRGIAFNVMSKYLDWERDDLFHLPFDTLARFLDNNISRNFTLRHDYGLYEYTVYVYKKPFDEY